MIEISEKESKTSHGTHRGANEQESGIDCPQMQGVVIRLRSLLIFSAGLAIFQGRSYGSAKPRAEANNTYQEPITPSHGPQSDVALGNHTLRA